MLDLDLAAYTLVTYQASRLDPSVLQASEAIIVTHESDPAEIGRLHALLGGKETEAAWQAVLGSLAVQEAALLSGPEESPEELRRFSVAPRLTSHVRHQHKYLDMPVASTNAFVFTDRGVPTGPCAHSLLEFVGMASACTQEVLKGHMRRHDFSKWIRDIFRDPSLASQVHSLETRRDLISESEIKVSLARLIWERYISPIGEDSRSG